LDKEHKVFLKDESIRSDDIYRTATGRILLANMNAEELKKIYAKFGAPKESEWSGIQKYDQLAEKLAKIAKREIVVTTHRFGEEISVGFGGAIFKGYQCIGAVGLAAMLSESEYEEFLGHKNELIEILKRGIAEINRRIRYS
jgi:DNA-binding IclR family transcriptional regulator